MEFHSHPTFQGMGGAGASSAGSRTFDSSSYKSFTLLPQNTGGFSGFAAGGGAAPGGGAG